MNDNEYDFAYELLWHCDIILLHASCCVYLKLGLQLARDIETQSLRNLHILGSRVGEL
jgi:hypothetical protein